MMLVVIYIIKHSIVQIPFKKILFPLVLTKCPFPWHDFTLKCMQCNIRICHQLLHPSMMKRKRRSFLSCASHFIDPRHLTSFLCYKTLPLPTSISCSTTITTFSAYFSPTSSSLFTFTYNGQKPIPQAGCRNETVPLWSGYSLFLTLICMFIYYIWILCSLIYSNLQHTKNVRDHTLTTYMAQINRLMS